MDTTLSSLAVEVLSRLEGRALPAEVPQLLVCSAERGLLRGPQGAVDVPLAALPARVDFSPLIDHTVLKAAAMASDIDQLCQEARAHLFASVCVNPVWVPRAAAALQGVPVRVCTVVGFPLGATSSEAKAFEAKRAIADGATEVDMVLSIGQAKSGDWEGVRRDMAMLRQATEGVCLKVILETCLLTDAEKVRACEIAVEEGLDFVKTSTGFSTGGATEADIRLMRATVGSRCGVKASGAVRTYAEARTMVLAGATRLGLSSSLAVISGTDVAGSGY